MLYYVNIPIKLSHGIRLSAQLNETVSRVRSVQPPQNRLDESTRDSIKMPRCESALCFLTLIEAECRKQLTRIINSDCLYCMSCADESHRQSEGEYNLPEDVFSVEVNDTHGVNGKIVANKKPQTQSN